MIVPVYTLYGTCGHAEIVYAFQHSNIPIDREESNVRKDKRITMAQ